MKVPNARTRLLHKAVSPMTLYLHEMLDNEISYVEGLLLQGDSADMLGPQTYWRCFYAAGECTFQRQSEL